MNKILMFSLICILGAYNVAASAKSLGCFSVAYGPTGGEMPEIYANGATGAFLVTAGFTPGPMQRIIPLNQEVEDTIKKGLEANKNLLACMEGSSVANNPPYQDERVYDPTTNRTIASGPLSGTYYVYSVKLVSK